MRHSKQIEGNAIWKNYSVLTVFYDSGCVAHSPQEAQRRLVVIVRSWPTENWFGKENTNAIDPTAPVKVETTKEPW